MGKEELYLVAETIVARDKVLTHQASQLKVISCFFLCSEVFPN